MSIPYKALRECCINAFCHRTYAHPGSSVGIAIYDDRVEIENTGSFPADLPLAELLREHRSKPRNPIIANVLYKSDILENWGRGISLMVNECRRVGIPDPEFHSDGEFVWVVFRYIRHMAGQASDNPTSTPQVPHKYPASDTPYRIGRRCEPFCQGNDGHLATERQEEFPCRLFESGHRSRRAGGRLSRPTEPSQTKIPSY